MRRRDWQHEAMTATSLENGNGRSEQDGQRDERLASDATAWFVRMTSDLVTDADRRDFAIWLARDPDHGAAYAEAEALWAQLEDLPDPRVAKASERSIAPSAPAERRANSGSRRRLSRQATGEQATGKWRAVGLAASLVLAVGLGLWAGAPWVAGAYDSWRADHATTTGERRVATLPDGSRVHLNGRTALTVDFTADRRRVGLSRGEAFFMVASDPERPFEVAVEEGVARAVGTSFNVRAVAERIEVAVAEGLVELRRPPARPFERGSDDETVRLAAGQAAGYATGRTARTAIETRNVDLAAVTAWRQGRLVFVDRPLRAVIAELDRHRPGRILFLDSALAEARFTGVLGLSDSDRALDAIETTLPVEALRVTPWLTLLRARD